MNTERFCVIKLDDDKYFNRIFNFTGTMSECRAFASSKGFGGGVEVLEKRSK